MEMMMTTSSNNHYDICGVCETQRDQHGDKMHEFNVLGTLIPKAEPEAPRQSPPQLKGDELKSAAQVLGSDPVARLQLRLITRLVNKGLLDGNDLVHIFGGD